jgi:hypothetical protein
MVVCQPSPEDSESEHGGGSTGLPEWQLLDWDDVELVEEMAVEQIICYVDSTIQRCFITSRAI